MKENKTDDTIITDSKNSVKQFNNNFVDIVPGLAAKIPSNINYRFHLDYVTNEPLYANFTLNQTNSFTVFSLLSKLCTSKGTGLDNISPRLLRNCSDIKVESLCDMFNRSIENGIFPEDWKCTTALNKRKETTFRLSPLHQTFLKE